MKTLIYPELILSPNIYKSYELKDKLKEADFDLEKPIDIKRDYKSGNYVYTQKEDCECVVCRTATEVETVG